MEIWKDVIGYEGKYQVSNFGRLKCEETVRIQPRNGGIRVYPAKIIIPFKNNQGYLKAGLRLNNKSSVKFMHRIVCEAFYSNPSKKEYVNHINGIKSDNHVDNLEWVTPKENSKHAIETGLSKNYGSTHSKSKLTDLEVFKIRELHMEGIKTVDISKIYNVTPQNIGDIVNRKRWKHI